MVTLRKEFFMDGRVCITITIKKNNGHNWDFITSVGTKQQIKLQANCATLCVVNLLHSIKKRTIYVYATE